MSNVILDVYVLIKKGFININAKLNIWSEHGAPMEIVYFPPFGKKPLNSI